MDYPTLGQSIRMYRKKLHLTQEQLAEQAGVSASFMGHIERGTRIASLESFVRICQALNVTPNDLLLAEIRVSQESLPNVITISPAEFLQGIVLVLKNLQNPE